MKRSRAIAIAMLALAAGGAHAEKIVRPVGPEVVVVEGSYDLVIDRELGVAGDDFGNFVIVWDGRDDQSGLQVRGVKLSADDVPNAPFDVGGDPLQHNFLPRVAMQPSGAFVVAWATPGVEEYSQTILARRFDSTTAPQSDVFPLDGVPRVPNVAMDAAGNFVAVWEPTSQPDVEARRFDATGTPISDVFRVNSDARRGGDFAVAADGTGGFVVTWSGAAGSPDGALLEARRFDASGTAVGPDMPVSQSASDADFAPAVGADAAGDFVVAWFSHYDENRYGSAVVARRFDATATPRADEEQLAKGVYYTGNEAPRVAVDPSGEFVVVWGNSYDSRTVFARASAGDGFSATFSANQADDGGAKRFATVATGGSGDFLVVWFDRDRGLVARRLGPRRTTTKLRIIDDGDPSHRKLTIKPVGEATSSRLGRRIDPASEGAFLHVYNPSGATSDSACIPLPAAHWQAKGADPAGATRFVYRDPEYADGPCSGVTVANRKVVKASCRATLHPIDVSLDEPQQGTVVVRLVTGDRAYCSVFGPEGVTDRPGRFAGINAGLAGACPVAAAACP